MLGRPFIVRRRLVTGWKYLLRGAGGVVVHSVPDPVLCRSVTLCGSLLAADHDAQQECRFAASVHPGMVGGALHDRVEGFEPDRLALVEQERNLTREEDEVIDCRRHVPRRGAGA